MPRQPSRFPHSAPLGLAPREALIHAAKSALAARQPARAQALLAAPLRHNPDDPVLLSFAGLAHRGLGDTLGALALLERAVALAPDLAPTRLALAETFNDAYRPRQALATLDALPEAARRAPTAVLARAAALGQLGDQRGEAAVLGELAALAPDHVATRLRLGHAVRALGDTAAALSHYRAVLALIPTDGAAWWSIANLHSARFDGADREAMRMALADDTLGDDDRIGILFALARAEEQAGDPDAAFALYTRANALRHARSPHNRDVFDRHVDAAHSLFTPAFFAARAAHGCPSTAPIFIVGIHRSGSTLLEQMLSSHPAIEGTAELPYINQLVREVRRDAHLAGQSFEQRLALLDPAATRALGEDYLARAAAHRHGDRPMFLDKTPNNWAHAGFIRLILPQARIIDVRRHPMACGYSNFRQLYASGLDHTYSLDDWAHHYRFYLGFMAHLDAACPKAIQRILYERLVDDPERELRRLCDALDLDFAPAMLAFHANPRTVRTISAEQVRQPLHRDALDEWRRFETQLAPLHDALGPALASWDAPQEDHT